jgi:GT2 family glycosyltransferase
VTKPHNGRVTPKRVQGGPVILGPHSGPVILGPHSEPEGRELLIPASRIKPRDQEKVIIGWPHPEDVKAKFMRSMLFLFQYDAVGRRGPDGRKLGGKQRIVNGGGSLDMEGGATIARNRNRLVDMFLKESDADWLLQIDTDMVFDPDLVERLVEAAHPVDRPIVGGLCFAVMNDQSRTIWPTLYAFVPGVQRLRRLTQYPADTLIPVSGTGAACLLVHRTVLEAMRDARTPEGRLRFPPPRPWFDETKFYEIGDDGQAIQETGDEYSEDLSFCLRAQALGFAVHVHTGVRLGHVKSFTADEGRFIAESESLQEACRPALPTYAVIASKDRPEMLATLVAQLADQCTTVFIMDNGYENLPHPPNVEHQIVDCHGWSLTSMWERGWQLAWEAADTEGAPLFNLLVLNDDTEIPSDFAARLEAALRVSDDHWISYPNHREMELPPEGFARTQSDSMAGQTMSGFAFMVRGEVSDRLRFDPQFAWFYSDSDLERQTREAGRFTVCVNTAVRHLEPMKSTVESAERTALAWGDEARFAAKWGLDVESLWMHQNRDKLPLLSSAAVCTD